MQGLIVQICRSLQVSYVLCGLLFSSPAGVVSVTGRLGSGALQSSVTGIKQEVWHNFTGTACAVGWHNVHACVPAFSGVVSH